MYWRAINTRRKTIALYDAVAPSPTQRIFQLMTFKESYEAAHGSVSNSDLASIYNANLQEIDSNLEDTVSENWVDTAIKIFKRAFAHENLLAEVLRDECENGKNGMFQTSCLEEICNLDDLQSCLNIMLRRDKL